MRVNVVVPGPMRRSAGEENELLRRIASDPADEAPQLAYADWLDQYRDPLADLIRVRLERSKLSDRRLAEHEQELAAKTAKKEGGTSYRSWLTALGVEAARARIRLNDDGQIHHIDIRDYQVNVGALREFAGYPTLRELELNAHPLAANELDALVTIRELHFHDIKLADDGLKPSAAW